jgi:hypothetical protein
LPNHCDHWQELAIIIERSVMTANFGPVSPECAKRKHSFLNKINLLSGIIREQPDLAASHHTL